MAALAQVLDDRGLATRIANEAWAFREVPTCGVGVAGECDSLIRS